MSSRRAKGPVWDAGQLHSAMLRRVERNTELKAELAFAAIPSLLEHYAVKCERLFEVAARPLQGPERGQFRALLAKALRTGFEASAHAKVVVRCASDPAPKLGISYEVGVQVAEIADVYRSWLRVSEPPYFGTHPDAKVMAVASGLPRASRALDIGAGTGRNSLPLARTGLRVDAVELTPGFVAVLREEAARAELELNAVEGDAFDPDLGLADEGYAMIVASEVVSSHVRDVDDLREFFELAARKLTRTGVLVCNVFLARSDYVPSALARELSPSLLSTLFTDEDLAQASRGLPLSLVSDESCASYERAHLPTEAWPPTGWFEAWASGKNLFDVTGLAPSELRWLVYRKD